MTTSTTAAKRYGMRTYTIHHDELEQVSVRATMVAPIDVPFRAREPTQPVLPTQVRQLKRGWPGAEWVRAVADYQDAPSIGYESLADLELDHEFSPDWNLDWHAR